MPEGAARTKAETGTSTAPDGLPPSRAIDDVELASRRDPMHRQRALVAAPLLLCLSSTLASAYPPTDLVGTQAPVGAATNARRVAVRLAWREADSTVVKFLVKRKQANSGWQLLTEIPYSPGVTDYAYTDKTIPNAPTVSSYRYRVFSWKSSSAEAATEIVATVDADLDTVTDVLDNCVGTANSNQLDGDGDGLGD